MTIKLSTIFGLLFVLFFTLFVGGIYLYQYMFHLWEAEETWFLSASLFVCSMFEFIFFCLTVIFGYFTLQNLGEKI